MHYTLAVNTTGGTPEEKASRHVTLVGTTNVFSLNYRKLIQHYNVCLFILQAIDAF
jgi:hypothetical protein